MTAVLTRPSLKLQWDRDGFVIARGLFDPAEIAAASADADRVREEFKHLVNVKNIRCRWHDNVFTGECQFDAFDPIIDLSPACKILAYDRRLFDLLADLYGGPACLFKDKLIYKLPGAKGYGLHQDWIAWGTTGSPAASCPCWCRSTRRTRPTAAPWCTPATTTPGR